MQGAHERRKAARRSVKLPQPNCCRKTIIIHSIYGNAAKCLRFYGPLPVWCALNRNKYREERGVLRWPNELSKTAKSLPNENDGWLFQYPHEWLHRWGTLVSLEAHDVRTLDQEEGYSMPKNPRVNYKNCMK